MLQSESLDFFPENAGSLQEVFSLFVSRVDRPPFECIHEPFSALLFVFEELCHIKSTLNYLLALFLLEFLANLASFIEHNIIVYLNEKAMKLIS